MLRNSALLLALLLVASAAQAAHTARGQALETAGQLLCEEPLNANAVTIRFKSGCGPNSGPAICDAGSPWPGALNVDGNTYIDPDDSLGAWECDGALGGTPIGYSVESVLGTGLFWVPLATEASHLPPGATVAGVLKRTGSAVGQVGGKAVQGSPGTTWCSETYERFDETSDIPAENECINFDNSGNFNCPDNGQIKETCNDPNNCGDGVSGGCNNTHTCACCKAFHEQYKLVTIGGGTPADADNTTLSHLQMNSNMTFGGPGDGVIEASSVVAHFGVSNKTWNDGSFSMGNMTECQTNWCRLEVCLDYMADQHIWSRFRMTVLAPGTPVVHTAPIDRSPGTAATLDWLSGTTINFNHSPQFFTQVVNGTVTRYVWGAKFTKSSNLSDGTGPGTFWIGCDPAMESGCNPVTGTTGPSPPFVGCTNNGPIVQLAGFSVTANASSFTGNTPVYTFDMGSGTRGSCQSQSGTTSGSCNTITGPCICTVDASTFAVGTKALSCAMSDSITTTPVVGNTTLTITAPPGGIPPGINGSAKGSFTLWQLQRRLLEIARLGR